MKFATISKSFKDGLEGVPFDAVSEEPGSSIRDIGDGSISDLVERLNPFLKAYFERRASRLRQKLSTIGSGGSYGICS